VQEVLIPLLSPQLSPTRQVAVIFLPKVLSTRPTRTLRFMLLPPLIFSPFNQNISVGLTFDFCQPLPGFCVLPMPFSASFPMTFFCHPFLVFTRDVGLLKLFFFFWVFGFFWAFCVHSSFIVVFLSLFSEPPLCRPATSSRSLVSAFSR